MEEINYEEITIQDCIDNFELKGTRTVIGNGKVIGFEEV